MLLAMLRGITLRRDMGLGHFFLNGRHENRIWAIFSLLNDIESYFWCLHLCFQGQKIE